MTLQGHLHSEPAVTCMSFKEIIYCVNLLVNMFAFAPTLCSDRALQYLRMHLSVRAAGYCTIASQQEARHKREHGRPSAEWMGHRVEGRLQRSAPALLTHWNHRLCTTKTNLPDTFSTKAAAVFVSFSHGDDLIVTPFAQVSRNLRSVVFLLLVAHYFHFILSFCFRFSPAWEPYETTLVH